MAQQLHSRESATLPTAKPLIDRRKPHFKMINYFSIFILTISFSLNAQNENNKLIHKDSSEELYMMNTISEENLTSLKVCQDFLTCKGFLTEKDTSGTTLHQMDVRAIISRISDFQYKIEYKYRESKQFIADTFNIYCLDNSLSIAYPININISNLDYFGDFIPSSSDERDVVFITNRDEKIIFYKKLK